MRGMRWDGHVACTDERRNKYRVWWKCLKVGARLAVLHVPYMGENVNMDLTL
jgi:hypothetical protein